MDAATEAVLGILHKGEEGETKPEDEEEA